MQGSFSKLVMQTVIILAASGVSAGFATAESLTFHVKSRHENVVSLEFYSQDRDHSWPGGDQVYLLEDYNARAFTLQCISGETICYGAWVRNQSDTFWGVGLNSEEECSDCCYSCDGGETEEIVLDP